ncbi:sulfite reductase [Cellulomonas sp. Root485]|uniref:nitrite/sulfite reductase n=1 Tax=Cellulomonas sp. Root485 TaxID=1736546 RepID=UPI000701BD08|nr:nitrite/sulfite reductase [Cellulomonas sp. Root485]KQY24977.1 sulfite reductase [Cellulomonas sp. Root485]
MAQTRIAPPAARAEGQWAFDQKEPLNGNELFKQQDDALNVRQRIEDVYSREGFASIAPEDLRGRMRWWGLYTQRKPGIDGGKTATLEPHELDDEYFMLRVRCDGGALSLQQLRTVADISVEFGRGTADVTDRQNIQLHWIRVEDVPEIWRRLEAVGLSTQEACGDCPRVVLGSPVAGVAADEIIDGTPAVRAIVDNYIGDPRFSNLPRKFKTAISGSPHHDVAHEINDVAFVGVVHPTLGPGFDVWVGGGLSTNPKLGVRLGAFVTLEQIPEVWVGVVSIFRDYGYRRLRTRARLKFLVADWGPELFRQVLEGEYLGFALEDGPEPPPPPTGRRDHVGVHPQKDGNFYVGMAPTVGRISGELLQQLADLVETAGSDKVRLTVEQKIVVLDVAPEKVDPLVEGLEALGLPVREASTFRRGTMACTGIEFCKLAIVETKARATHVIGELEKRLPTFDQPITINLNGCPNSCARIQTADIGLKGALAGGEDGYQVHLGGGLGLTSGLGKTLRGLRVPAEELPDYIERVTRKFDEQRLEGELFAQWTQRADEEDLR